jgi:uncharacterized protein YdeI (YjbR/CyaY-like superfamily)
MSTKDPLPTLHFSSQAEWEAWLAKHGGDSPGLWLQLAKKASGIPSVTYEEALESALSYGWIDGQKATGDEGFWRQKFTPRGSRSRWSRINRDKATLLLAAGRMRPAGLRQVELAQADGRWDAAYDSQSQATIPDDLARELESHPAAAEFFSTLNSVNRYAILYRIQSARKLETRAQRIQRFIQMLENHERIYPQSP